MDLDATLAELAPKVLAYCILATGDCALAEELAQDALSALVQRWRRLGPPDSAVAFVFAIARRRSARAVVRRRLLLPIEAVLGRSDGRPDPEEIAAGQSDRRRVIDALSRLRRRDREVLLMLTVGDTGIEDAARTLGVSVSAVKMRALRARARLRELLEVSDVARRRRTG